MFSRRPKRGRYEMVLIDPSSFTILGVLEFWRLEGERERAFKVMSLRENEALLKSYLNLSKNLALEIGDEDLLGFTEKIKKRADGIITGGRKAPYWLYTLISVLGFIEIRRNLNVLKNLLLDLRLGILWERVELGGDFKILEGKEECPKGCQVLIE